MDFEHQNKIAVKGKKDRKKKKTKQKQSKDGVHDNDLGQATGPLADAFSPWERGEAALNVLQGVLYFRWSEAMIKGG